MKTIALTALLAVSGLTLSACATARGAAIGGVGGAAVAAATDGDVEKGAAVGGTAGAVIGTVAD
jgi:osmotically inducible lipoprotein OsmB